MTVFAVVEKGDSAAVIRYVYPLVRANFELRFFYTVYRFRASSDMSELDIAVDRIRKVYREEIRSQHLVRFVPVGVVLEIDDGAVRGKVSKPSHCGFAVGEELFHARFAVFYVRFRRDKFHLFAFELFVIGADIPRVVRYHALVGIYPHRSESRFDEFSVSLRFQDKTYYLTVLVESRFYVCVFDSICFSGKSRVRRRLVDGRKGSA